MPLFKNQNGKLLRVKEDKFQLERDLQRLAENNLETVFGLSFIATEFALNGLRIDTLAFDEETQSFVIIEYKRDSSFSVVDQGFAYLSLMLNNKAEFILAYNEKMKNSLKKDDVDWSQSRVIFVASSFTIHQKNAINFKDLPIELWEAKKYENEIFFNQIKAENPQESIKTISKDKRAEDVKREIKTYNYEDYFKEGWEESMRLTDALTERLSTKYSVNFKFTQNYISVQPEENKNLVTIKPMKSKIQVFLNRIKANELNDPQKKAKDIPNSFKYYHKNVCIYEIEKDEDIEYAMFLIDQVYKKDWA